MRQPDILELTDEAWSLVQRRCFGEANALFTRLCELSPSDPEAWMMRGATQLELGDAEGAECYLKKALELDPGYADPWLHLGKLAFNAGALGDARQFVDRAVSLDPDYTEAWVLRAAVCELREEREEVERSARRALALNPQDTSPLMMLVRALQAQGKDAAALDSCRQLVQNNPDSVEAALFLGDLLVRLRKYDEATASYERFLEHHPSSLQGWFGLGLTCLKRGDLKRAVTSYRKAAALQPDNAQAHNNVGNALLAMRDVRGAETAFRKALLLAPDLAEAHANLGVVLQGEGKFGGARKCYQAALTQMAHNADLHSRLASTMEMLGDFEGAINHCDQAASIEPGNPEFRVKKARVLQKMGEHAQVDQLLTPDIISGSASISARVIFAESGLRLGNEPQALSLLEDALGQDNLSPFDRQRLHSSLGMVYDRKGKFDTAFMHFTRANQLKTGTFDLEEHERYIKSLIQTFTRDFLAHTPRGNSAAEQPVFVVGMPRSGTSLVEQLLASHPEVHGVGEKEDIGRLASELAVGASNGCPVNPANLTQEKLAAMAQDYLTILREERSDAKRITEKMPHNFLHLGLIEMLFPRARVIHVKRDPLDTCLSCYFQQFNDAHAYTHDLATLGKYYKLYEAMMRHWERALTLPLLEVRYESLVENQEIESRRLIAFCGLEWDERVLRFHETRRNVATPSFEQVRQPMYKKSVQRWRNYEPHIAPLLAALR